MNNDVCVIDQYGRSVCDQINKSLSNKIFYDYDPNNYSMKSKRFNESSVPSNYSKYVEKYGKDRWYLEGIFTITEKPNRNGNLYHNEIVEPEVLRYNENRIKKGISLGETMHPVDRDLVDPDLASCLTLEYYRQSPESNIYVGKLLILNTPKGRTLQDLLEDHVTLSVSTRSLGLAKKESYQGQMVDVLTEWDLLAVDVVLDPSVFEAVMQAINESRYINKDLLTKKQNERFLKRIDETVRRTNIISMRTEEFASMIQEIIDTVGKVD